jgi:large subunit ribosomal protein L35
MPKFKPHTGTGKRVKITARGKILTEQSGVRHKLEGKSSRRTRRQSGTADMASVNVKRVKRLLGR